MLSDDHCLMHNRTDVTFPQRGPDVSSHGSPVGVAAMKLYVHVRLEFPFFVFNGVGWVLSRQPPSGSNTVVDVFHKLTTIPDHGIVEER